MKLQEASPLKEGVLRLNKWEEPVGWILVVFMLLAGAYLLLVPASRPPRFDGPLRFVLGMGWLAFGGLIASTVRAGVTVYSDGVLVRTRLREHSWDWKEIAEFSLRHSVYRPGLQIRLHNGAQLKGLGLTGRSTGEWELAERIVAELNCRVGRTG
jgi:hypothetical protein